MVLGEDLNEIGLFGGFRSADGFETIFEEQTDNFSSFHFGDDHIETALP